MKLKKATKMESNKKTYQYHYENSVQIPAKAAEIFKYLDNHALFSSHMSKKSWMMGGGKMNILFDKNHGQKVGSHIIMSGKAFGINISLNEIVIKYKPPYLKTWMTVGTPKLLVIGHYRMKVRIKPRKKESLLQVSIDYNFPKNILLGILFGKIYAMWCVKQMIDDADLYFKRKK